METQKEICETGPCGFGNATNMIEESFELWFHFGIER